MADEPVNEGQAREPELSPHTASTLWEQKTDDQIAAAAATVGETQSPAASPPPPKPTVEPQGQPAAGEAVGAAPVQPTITPEILAQAMRLAMPAPQAAPPPPQKDMTPEEYDKMFQVAKFDQNEVNALASGNPEQIIGALTSIGHKIVRQAVTAAQLYTIMENQNITRSVAPAIEYAKAVEREQLKTDFFSANPDMKQLEPLLLVEAQRLEATNAYFPDKQAAFNYMKDYAANIRKTLNLPAGTSAGVQTTASGRKMTPVTPGGQATSAGGQATAPSKQDRVKALFT